MRRSSGVVGKSQSPTLTIASWLPVALSHCRRGCRGAPPEQLPRRTRLADSGRRASAEPAAPPLCDAELAGDPAR